MIKGILTHLRRLHEDFQITYCLILPRKAIEGDGAKGSVNLLLLLRIGCFATYVKCFFHLFTIEVKRSLSGDPRTQRGLGRPLRRPLSRRIGRDHAALWVSFDLVR